MNWLSNLIGIVWEWVAHAFIGRAGAGNVRAAAFVRYDGAMGAGHLGWAFDYDATRADAGAVEDPTGAASCPPHAMGYWNELTGAPVHMMKSRGYNDLRYVEISNGNVPAAYRVAKWIGTQPYALFGRNCMDDTYDVLRMYGLPNLPVPSQDILPNEWFVQFGGELASVATFVWTKERVSPLRSTLMRSFAKLAPPTVPTWRRVGHPDYHAFHAQLLSRSAQLAIQGRASDSRAAGEGDNPEHSM